MPVLFLFGRVGVRIPLLDRDTKYLPLRGVLENSGSKPVLLPPRSPNLNAHVERLMRSVKSECPERMIFFGKAPLRPALAEFVAHCHGVNAGREV